MSAPEANTRNIKNIYKIGDNTYTYGKPGAYAPRIKRIQAIAKDGSARGRPTYKRVRGGPIPEGIHPETKIALALLAALQAADKTPEA